MLVRSCPAEGNAQVVDKILDIKRSTNRNYITWFWSIIFLCLACFGCIELNYGLMEWPILTAWYAAVTFFFGLGFFLLLKCIFLPPAVMEITERQRELCGVSKSDPRFQIASPNSAAVTASTTGTPKFSPSLYTGYQSYYYPPSAGQQTSFSSLGRSLPLSRNSFDEQTGGFCPPEVVSFNLSSNLECNNSSMASSVSPNFSSHHSSASYMSNLLDSSILSDGSTGLLQNSPMNLYSGSKPSGFRGGSPTMSPTASSDSSSPYYMRRDVANGSGTLQQRKPGQNLTNRSSPLKSGDFISSPQDLENYLQSPSTAKDFKMKNGMFDGTSSGLAGFSFSSFNRTMMDYMAVIRRYQYQLAPHSVPQLAASADNPQHDLSVCTVTEDVWSKLDIDYYQVEQWVENLRKWICLTIFNRLNCEIVEANKTLVNIGSEEVQIGEVSLSTIKQWASVKGQLVPKLATLLPFLELSSNQEYLVQRLKELGSGGCMSAFKWNGGGDFKGKPWEENLPTDSAIVMHLLCCYMDLRLPSHPKYPDGKTFTSQHFLRAPAEPNLKDRKDHLLLYEVRIHPPHYNIVIDDTVWIVKSGRNNLFHAILLFLHHLKTKENGMLRRVSLGLSGINILWVVDT